ncbi:MAG TPA: crosslink repair DNA glycosylase YcaQ family protein, partial [Solirubrobacteraceae bacterium]|nr:crosslink repair DNA glycosylase YcaQ family protein [Solirubrobacteraceae bacterium]
LGAVAERARGRLRVFGGADGRELLDLPGAPRPDPATPAPVRFLPPWDNLLRAHADRTRVMSDAVREALRRPNDVVPGTVLVDGFVAATWEQTVTAEAATLEIELLRPLSRPEAGAVAAEGRRLLGWTAPGLAARVAVSPPA